MATDYVVKFSGQDNLSGTINKVKQSLKEVGGSTDKIDQISKKFDKIQASTAPLRKKLKDTKAEMEKLAATGDTTSELFKRMATAAKQYQATLDKVNSATKNVTASTSKMNGVGNLASGITGAGTAVTGVLGMFGKFGDSASASILKVQSSLATLQGTQAMFSSGGGAALANPYVAVGAAIVGAGAAWFEYNKNLEEATELTRQFTGLSGNALESLRGGIKSVADTFGKDYREVLSSVDFLMNQYGIDGEAALNVIRDGFVAGADDSGKMLDMIQQYGGAFNDAGISASELVAIIGNTRSGIFSEEGMAVIQMASKNIRDMSKNAAQSIDAIGISSEKLKADLQSGTITTVQALQQISNKMKEFPAQSAEVGAVLQDVFGKKGAAAGYELVTALADVETNLDVVKQQTGQWGEAMEQLQEADREMENALASLFGVADGGFSTMTTKLKAEVYGAVARVINGFIDWYNKSLLVRGAITGLATAFKNAWEIIKAILKLFMNSVESLAGMIEGVLTLDWNKVKSSWKNGMSNILKTIVTGFENIKDNMADAVDQTLNGQIKKIEVEAAVTSATTTKGNGSSTNSGSSNAEGSGSKSSSKTKKEEVVKTQIELDREALSKVQKDVQNAISDFNSGLIDKETLQKAIDEANKYYQEHNIKANVELEFKQDKQGFEQAAIKKTDNSKEVGSIAALEAQYSKLNEELKNTPVSDERLKEILAEKAALEEEINQLKIRNGLADSKPQAKEGSIEFVQNKIAEQEAKLKLEVVGTDEYKRIAQEIADLKDQEHTIQLKIDNDGIKSQFEQTSEAIEQYKAKMQGVSELAGTVGNSFSQLGSAVGGTGGAFLDMAGQTISAIAQIIPQIVSLIGAQEAEALAAGTASGAALPFPANIAAIASIIATITGLFAGFAGSFADGGIVAGGSMHGDRLLARVNSGEMILNNNQQANLFNALDGTGIGANMGGNVKFEIDGRVIKGVLKNVNSKANKQS